MKKEAKEEEREEMAWDTEGETTAVCEPSLGFCPHRTSHMTIRRLALLPA